jgi:hypothetical protein
LAFSRLPLDDVVLGDSVAQHMIELERLLMLAANAVGLGFVA